MAATLARGRRAPIFEPSATTTARWALTTMAWLVRASVSSCVVTPLSAVMPSAPRIAVPTLTALNVLSARAPTSSSDCGRRNPPVITIRTPG